MPLIDITLDATSPFREIQIATKRNGSTILISLWKLCSTTTTTTNQFELYIVCKIETQNCVIVLRYNFIAHAQRDRGSGGTEHPDNPFMRKI